MALVTDTTFVQGDWLLVNMILNFVYVVLTVQYFNMIAVFSRFFFMRSSFIRFKKYLIQLVR